MNRSVPGPQQLRAMPGNSAFPNPQASSNRGPLLGAGRMQNGKLGGGNNAGWGFGGPIGGAPGLAAGQSRANFAQTLGGNQSHSSLDMSEFPSLSNAPQAQQPMQSTQTSWGTNPPFRAMQQTPVQRGQNLPSNTQTTQQHDRTPLEEHQGAQNFRTSGDDFRFNPQGNASSLAGGSTAPGGSNDDFPPLSGSANGDIGVERRAGPLSSQDFGSSSSPFGHLGQSRNGLSSPNDSQKGNTVASTIGDRSQGRPHPDERNNDHAKGYSLNQGLGNGVYGGPQSSQAPFRSNTFRDTQPQPPIGARLGQNPQDQAFGGELLDSENTQPQTRHKRLAEMTESERWGIAGLLAVLPQESPDHSSLTLGQDLTQLGLDLNRPDNSPLHPNFGTPFNDANARPVIPDFTLPPAYTVTNVPPLHAKMSSFSNETLFMIFYTRTRDIHQELAAAELYNRDWRWHKGLRQWMMKDPDLPQPVRISDRSERGWYIFFDINNWRRERREFELNYDHLDQRHAGQPSGGTQ